MDCDIVKRGILLIGGEGPSANVVRQVCESADLIYAADSGFDLAVQAEIQVDFVLGDFDSVQSVKELELLDAEKIKSFPSDKDYSDTELGLIALKEQECSEIVLVGGGGGRLDHLIAILSIFDRSFCPIEWITRDHRVICIDTEYIYNGSSGETVSFFPAGMDPCTMDSTGLKWPLNDVVWHKGDVGLSNVVVSGTCEIHMKTGRLLMVCEM